MIFIEGPIDEDIVREWSSKLSLRLSEINAGFIQMEGARNLSYFAQDATLSFLSRRRVVLYFIMDRDEKSSEDVAKITARLSGTAKVFILKRRELENYLVCDRVLADFISQKRHASGRHDSELEPTVSSVAAALSDCADELRPLALAKRVAKAACGPVFPASLGEPIADYDAGKAAVAQELDRMIESLIAAKDSLPRVFDEQTGALEQEWHERKLELVPGDSLLRLVCARFGTTFSKRRDSVRLAELFSADEIDPEIRRILEEIGDRSAT